MSDQEKPKGRRKKLLVIIGVVLVVVLAIGAGVGLRWWQQSQQPAPLPQLPESVSKLDALRGSGDEAAFNSELDKALADPSTDNDTKYLLYIQQGHNAMQNKEWQTALDAYGKAQAIKDDMQANRLLGDAYYGAGDSAKAVEQYKKAISLILDSNPRRDAIKREYENRIKEIESGTPPEEAEEEPQE